jgi:hypothetical protein
MTEEGLSGSSSTVAAMLDGSYTLLIGLTGGVLRLPHR